MNVKHVIIGPGLWGAGEAEGKARENYRKAGGRKNDRVAHWLFTSELPFAPSNRDATEAEADAYVSDGGSLCWIRCERIKAGDKAVEN